MDTGKPLEDQFSRLHPCMPVTARIAVVGAGPSGLSAAYALAQLGYRNVTVFDKYQSVGGMCESAEIEGRIYDLGGQVIAGNSAPVISHLARETRSELVEMDMHKLAVIDPRTGRYEDLNIADDYVSIMPLTLKLQDEAKNSGRIGVHALSDVATDPAEDFVKLHGGNRVPRSVAYGYTASGYGYVQDVPYAYVQEFTRTSMAGKIRRFKDGYTSMWHKLSQLLPFGVHCNTEVVAIKRGPFGCSVAIKDVSGKDEVMMEFDKIIVSGALPFSNGKIYRASTPSSPEGTPVLELNDRERALFSKVQTIDYYTTVLKIRGLGHLPKGFYYVGEFIDNPTTAMGHPVAMQRFFADTDIFLFWSYGNAGDITGETVAKFAADMVENMGGQVEKMVLQRRFKYFPHICSEDMKDGFYENLETQLQGFQNTYYVGGLMAFELTERNSSYSMEAVCRHFANDNAYPMFPYVKRLFPLLSHNDACATKELDAQLGVGFPDLPSLDSYLKFWGTHKTTSSKTLYTWINEERQVVDRRTYGELNENASYIAHKLLTGNKTPVIRPGDRVLLIYLPGLEFVDAFFGCLRAKVVPVPVLPPDPMQRGGQALTKLANASAACSAVAILSTSSYHAAVRAGFVKRLISLGKSSRGKSSSPAEWPSLPWLHTDSWIKSKSREPTVEVRPVETEAARPEDLCFLQFTSGSTGDAKGVMITHGGLIHNVKLMRRRYRSSSTTVLVSWLPQYHDMGLIGGLFTALVSGGAAVLFSPMTFIKNPLIWLETMSKYRATHSAGPNFAFELLVRRLESAPKEVSRTFDLSSLAFLMVAAEPVRQKTLKRFVEICGSFGLSQLVVAPGYGLAENCVFVSCAFGEDEPILVDWQGRVCCGYVSRPDDPDVDVKIVEDAGSGKELGDGQEGEIWISSPSAGIGYWGKQELSKNTFCNEIERYPGRKYTRTGDLGRVLDGKLFITGRIKDLVIVGGRNIYSADVEKTVESSSEFLRPGCCAVIGVPEEILSTKGIPVPDASDQVGLVVIAEVREGKPAAKEIVEEIKVRVAEEHGVPVASVQLIKPKTICKTTSGKIRRFECLKQFTDGTLSLASEPSLGRKYLLRSFTTATCADTRRTPLQQSTHDRISPCRTGKNRAEITEFLTSLVSEQTGIALEKISITESLVSYGIDSIGVVRAAQKLTDFLGVPVGAVDIFTASCISDLASFSENLLVRSQSQLHNSISDSTQCRTIPHLPQPENTEKTHPSDQLQFIALLCAQFIALVLASAMLILPAYLSTTISMNMLPNNIVASLLVAPLVWIMYIFFTCICLVLFENPLLKPNYAMITPDIPIASVDFVKWWALYKAREIAGKVLAVHLRGTVFLNWWFQMLGARIGSSVVIDTVDITDPSLVSVGDGTVVAEGALIQSHEVRNGTLRLSPIKIGRRCYVGPYTVIRQGSVLGEGSNVMPLQSTDEGRPTVRTAVADKTFMEGKSPLGEAGLLGGKLTPLYHFMGIYTVGLVSCLSAAILYVIYTQLSGTSFSSENFAFLCVAGALHWFPAVFAAYAAMVGDVPSKPLEFALFVAVAYLGHGTVLSLLTAASARFLARRSRGDDDAENHHLKAWLRHRLAVASHLRFAKLLTGTEAFCAYLRLMGAKIGRHCSIRAINPVTEPALLSIADGVHLGDFSRVLPGLYSPTGCFSHGKIKIRRNSVIGSQSLVLPGAEVEENVILGALSVAPSGATLQRGGVYLGSPTPAMVKNTLHDSDERIEDMEPEYRKIVGNLAANLAATTMKVKSRYFHRIGVGGRGVLRMRASLGELPEHKMFSAGRCLPVLLRHSNSLSADDDARIDARGAAVRILPETAGEEEYSPLLDLTLKTGKAFYARTIADFAAWLVCGLPAREKKVERAPHLRDAVWGSLRNADSYAELHYYSNICRLLRFEDGREMYAKFKLRPWDLQVDEDAGEVEPKGILPPETGAIPRETHDNRPPLFLADDFRRRVEDSVGGVRYVFQLQCREIPSEESEREAALDCTRPWDEAQFPYMDVGEIVIDRCLTGEESEQLEFNPFLRCREVDVIRATSSSQSASIDHGRSLVYEICQRLRGGRPLPVAWRSFLEQSDARLDLSACPVAAATSSPDHKDVVPVGAKLSLARSWPQTLWSAIPQPLLQTFVPYFVVGLAVFFPLKLALLAEETKTVPLHWALPLFWVSSGIAAALVCVLAKWVLVGKKKEGDTAPIWGLGIFMDAAWQALRTVAGDLFVEMAAGSLLFAAWMKLMGARVGVLRGALPVYVDSMGAAMNPDMVEMEGGSCVGREALLFGHIYEGDQGGMVKYGKIRVGERGFVGSRAVVMPGVRVEDGGGLGVLSLAMKEEIVRSR